MAGERFVCPFRAKGASCGVRPDHEPGLDPDRQASIRYGLARRRRVRRVGERARQQHDVKSADESSTTQRAAARISVLQVTAVSVTPRSKATKAAGGYHLDETDHRHLLQRCRSHCGAWSCDLTKTWPHRAAPSRISPATCAAPPSAATQRRREDRKNRTATPHELRTPVVGSSSRIAARGGGRRERHEEGLDQPVDGPSDRPADESAGYSRASEWKHNLTSGGEPSPGTALRGS